MSFYREFIKCLLPGNYALTKSMELTKIQSSGTLWYTKKFLTLYYFVFLSNNIMTNEYVQQVIDIFDGYIDSLDEKVQEEAYKFFYPDNEAINFRSSSFNTFMNFASYSSFASQNERNTYYQCAKKFYFTLLMGSGGQTGVKKYLKESIQKPGFVYSSYKINEEIMSAAISSCIDTGNESHIISDNSVKYIVSKDAIDKICRLSHEEELTRKNVKEIIDEYPMDNPKYRNIENDVPAFIRNERQILYYYGFFHSKTSGANDFEFSSLTPIGELALKANANEFLAIWEHQKIKMISQPATADINKIEGFSGGDKKFAISYSPYTDILGYLLRNNEMSLDEYKYIVSRKKSLFTEDEWISGEQSLSEHLEDIKDKVVSFGRKQDIENEDSRKELLKYLLGIRTDLKVDSETNPLSICSFKSSKVAINNKEALSFVYDVYSKATEYKHIKYKDVFIQCENDLKRRYADESNGINNTIDAKVKINWDLYNIRPDRFILLLSAISVIMNKKKDYSVSDIDKAKLDSIVRSLKEEYSYLMNSLGLKSLSALKKEIQKLLLALKTSDYKEYIGDEDEKEETVKLYRNESAKDLMEKIKVISGEATVAYSDSRVRNMTLIGLMKSYYMVSFANNNKLKCECCGEETFITSGGDPYLEFHHLIPFNIAYGPDHYLNLFALCPNCHRKIHFLNLDEKKMQYEMLDENNYLHLQFVSRLRELKTDNLLRSYHLEYLLADNAISAEEYNLIAM
ncbi:MULTISPECIES: HNH endonuclease [unclassified Campylobacter]|uniref:HNH endonuclease n=1 Tax=unclassified Campylobacter TaxID=2593542 RepID=UPI0022E9EBE2|nr:MULTISPECIES: HNH endonuclease [unclassified Campylobacter]MDA3042635.1 HNH endonuclease [Campylobacter sp. JMF_09 ED2]MDA3044551.1 HNH endonuclease [Campylobacter sp. JMF_07 ED4]MDA3063326.1 HNH endonuclease [Campylobacter sp. JMF_11 EL3]MDA3071528.1 HNH endonuclease [Campylobacter sp. VBCF_03 NA9]MDA3074408.1 HNH endonuclease [Campylobacter sp. JMF_05 ED3]